VAQEEDIRELLLALTPSARDALRRVLIHDQADRDAIFLEPAPLPRRAS
jgi:hypothetical protein